MLKQIQCDRQRDLRSRLIDSTSLAELSSVLTFTGLHHERSGLKFDELSLDEVQLSSSEDESILQKKSPKKYRVPSAIENPVSEYKQHRISPFPPRQRTPPFQPVDNRDSSSIPFSGTASIPGSIRISETEVLSTSSTLRPVPNSNKMAAIAAIVVPIVLGFLQKEVPVVLKGIKGLIDQAVAKFQAAHPGQSVWQVFGGAIAHLWRDNHIDEKIYNALHLGAFVAKISNFSHKLIQAATIDPALVKPPDLVANWDTAKLIDILSGYDSKTDPATVRKNMLKFEPVGTMAGMLNKEKFTLPGDLKSHVLGVFNRFNEQNEAKKPETIVPAPVSKTSDVSPMKPTASEPSVDSPRSSPRAAAVVANIIVTPTSASITANGLAPAPGSKATDSIAESAPKPASVSTSAPQTGTTGDTADSASPTSVASATATAKEPVDITSSNSPALASDAANNTRALDANPPGSRNQVPAAGLDAPSPTTPLLHTAPAIPPDPKPPLTPQWIAAHPEILDGIPEKDRPGVLQAINSMLRIQAISPTTTAMQELMKMGAPSSKAIVRNPKSAWVARSKRIMGVENAQVVYNNAQDQVIRLDNMGIGLLELIRGSGLTQSADGTDPSARKLRIQEHLSKRGYNLSIETLFGSVDHATAPESHSVYSPAAYFVELLEYLRNNNMDPKLTVADISPRGVSDHIDGTVLQHLFRRRPDLGNLQLTPENSNTVLPYIDLANEVMESFIVNLPSYRADSNIVKQAEIDAYNVSNEDSEELLSQPQNVSMTAYRQLAAAAYPTTLPYHQPLDMQRTFLNYLTLSRADLVDTFRLKPPALSPAAQAIAKAKSSDDFVTTITQLQQEVLDRQVDCERLGLVQEEYLILTKNVFWKPEFFSLTEGIDVSPDAYAKRIGLRSTTELWGYSKPDTLLDTNQVKQDGLRFVKKQLLPRSGIAYTDLIEIVQTTFVNPTYPSGRDKTILNSLQYSYSFLSTLVDQGSTADAKYGKLADFLTRSTKIINLAKALTDTIANKQDQRNGSKHNPLHIKGREIRQWILSRFEQIGHLIVLDAGEGPQLEVTGVLHALNSSPAANPPLPDNMLGQLTPAGKIVDSSGAEYKSGQIGYLLPDGSIKDDSGNIFARVNIAGRVIFGNLTDDTDINIRFPNLYFTLTPPGSSFDTWDISGGYLRQREPSRVVEWTIDSNLGGSASLEDVRLIHLDGESLSMSEWDRLHRFIRIWRKLGWSVGETDRALTGINAMLYPSTPPPKPVGPQQNGTNETVGLDDLITFDNFSDVSTPDDGPNESGAIGADNALVDIDPTVIRELAAIKQLLDLTEIPLEQLLTLWTNLSSQGTSSLFYRLFFTRRARTLDVAFEPDINGDYFTGKATKISEHRATVMAAFSIQSDDLDILLGLSQSIPSAALVSDLLNMDNLSAVYRAKLFARILGVGIADLQQIAAAFRYPAPSPNKCLATLISQPSQVLLMLQTWAKVKNASFPWTELRYILDSVPTPLDPLAPTMVDALKLSKTLHDGILDIQTANTFVTEEANATDELVKTKATIMFDVDTVSGILDLIHGTTIYTTRAPVIEDPNFAKDVADSKLSAKYNIDTVTSGTSPKKPTARLQITGILSSAQEEALQSLITPYLPKQPAMNGSDKKEPIDEGQNDLKAEWADSIARACAQSTNFFYDALVDIFPPSVMQDYEKDPTTLLLLAPDLKEEQTAAAQGAGSDLATPNANDKALHSVVEEQIPFTSTNGVMADIDSGDEDDYSGPNSSAANGISSSSKPLPQAPAPTLPEGQTAQAKALYFLRYFIPFLQSRLAHSFVIDAMADAAGFSDHALAKMFLEKIIVMDYRSQQSAIEFLLTSLGTNPAIYQGYLTPPVTGSYIFYLPEGSQPSPLVIDGHILPFTQTTIHRKTYLATPAISLSLPKVYTITVDNVTKLTLQWSQDKGAIKRTADSVFNAWQGYLNPPTADTYAISVVSDNQPPAIELDNSVYEFSLQQEDPMRIYTTRGIPLDPTRLYPLRLIGLQPDDLSWKSSVAVRSTIPPASFLPDHSKNHTLKLLNKMKKMGLLVGHFALSADEIIYLHSRHKNDDFDNLDFNSLANITQWQRIYDYLKLRQSLPAKTSQSLIDLFAWANNHADDASPPEGTMAGSAKALSAAFDAQAALAMQISLTTTWSVTQIQQILAHANFTTGKALQFVNEVKLLRMQKLIGYADQLGVDIPRIFEWCAPLGTNTRDFYRYADVAQDIQQTVRSKFDLDTWCAAVRPLNDKLRENQKNGLIGYLLVQQDLTIPNNITNADGLFEYFLIDVQMTPLVQTSRLKQAISTVQLFVQRCMLGLEKSRGVVASALDRERWQWMQKYRLWEGNRKIFLYPENWIEPSLRDDKSELFIQLEAELLQKDLTKDTVNTALRNYLYNVKQIANMQCIGLYVDFQDSSKIHVFARTRAAPYLYYYNWYLPNGNDGFWHGWERMEVDIPHYVVPNTGVVGNHVSPVVFNGSLVLFVAQIIPSTVASTGTDANTTIGGLSSVRVDDAKPTNIWQIQMGWTEYRNSKWSARQTCPGMYTIPQVLTQAQHDQALSAKNRIVTAQTSYDSAQRDLRIARLSGNDAAINAAAIFITVAKQELDFAIITFQPLAAILDHPVGVLTIDQFQIIPSIVQIPGSSPSDQAGSIKVYLASANVTQSEASWLYNGTQLSMLDNSSSATLFSSPSNTTSYSYSSAVGSPVAKLHSWQAYESQTNGITSVTTKLLQDAPTVENAETYPYPTTKSSTNNPSSSSITTTGPSIWLYNRSTGNADPQEFYHNAINYLLQGTSGSDPSNLFKALANLQDTNTIATIFGGSLNAITGTEQPSMTFNERRGAYTLYNWELGLHAPMIVIDRLFKAAQYEQALQVCQYVFNPLSTGDTSDMTRFWSFQPFKYVRTQTIEEYFLSFKPGQPNADVFNWRNNPFSPHVVARGRPQAYMKWVVTKYIQILIAWGDDLFRQNSLESIPLAIQCYVYANNIYGPRGQQYPRQSVKPETYNSLMTRLDAFDNAVVQLEEAFPLSNQTPLPVAKLPNDQTAHMANVFGSAGTLYFAIPDNPDLRALASTIDDRLFKIRHSQDINGIFRQLPLQDPPIDPALLVLATAQGLNLSSVLADLDGPLPNCRFTYLLDRALALTQEVRSFGTSLLSNREKRDSELLGNLRSKHELATNTSMLDLKKLALNDATANLESLQYQRGAAVQKLTYYLNLIGGDLSGVPQIDEEFNALQNKIDKPITDGGLAISPAEQLEMQKLQVATDLQTGVSATRLAAGVLHALPNVNADGKPVGLGVTIKWGPGNAGSLVDSIASAMSIGVEKLHAESSSAARLNQQQRAIQERIMAANSTGFEITNIDKQITAAKIRIDIANREINLQQQQIDQAREVNDFLSSKYSNVELYSWIDGQTKTLFYQTYSAAFALAIKAQKAFHYERPQKSSTSFIQPGYWDSSRDGLLSGETLMVALKQLESAYLEERGYDYEIAKSVSLRRLDPMQLIQLRENGKCQFTLPEVIYDMDFPGHYMRRIKSVSLTIPCLVGPFTSVNATLRLQSSQYRVNSIPQQPNSDSDPDPNFSTSTVPIAAIAVSSAIDDDGMFKLRFDDNAVRFLPFEGAGAISTWSLELPQIPDFKQFDYDSITDVVIHIKYTSIDGGSSLRPNALKNISDFIKSAQSSSKSTGMAAVFDIKNDFASGWSRLIQATSDRSIALPGLRDRLPYFTIGRPANQIVPTMVSIVMDKQVKGHINIGADKPDFGSAVPMGQSFCYSIKLPDNSSFGEWSLAFDDSISDVQKCLMVVSYQLK